MSIRRNGLKVLGLSFVAVLGLMAFMAVGAQAEESGGKWTYMNGAELKVLPNNESLGGEIDSADATLLTEILKKKVEFLCTSFTVQEGKLIEGGTALGRLTFHGCTTKVAGVTQAACEPVSEGHKGLITTNKIKGTLLLHKLSNGTKDKILIAEPDTAGQPFATIFMSELCSIGEEVPVGGKFAIIDCQGEGEVHKVKHLITEFAALTHLWAINDTAEHKATIDGSAFAFLSGANSGKAWAALWN